MACFRQLEAWRIGNFSFVRAVRCGRVGWYDTTSGVLSFVAFFAGGLRAYSWQRCLTHLICCCTMAGKAKQRLEYTTNTVLIKCQVVNSSSDGGQSC